MSMTLEKFLRRALAVTAVGAASVALAGCSLMGGGGPTAGNDDPSDGGEDTDVFTIKVGDCLNDGGAEGEVSTVEKIDCASPHDSEAFASVMLEDGDFPGDSELVSQADAICTGEEFENFVGLSYEESVLAYSYYYPTAESWESGDREVLCLIVEVDENGDVVKTEGSLEGAAR
jgi:hypothetical protein